MADGDEPQELLDMLDRVELTPAQGRRGEYLELEVVRPLGLADLNQIPSAKVPVRTLARVTTAHHRLAQLIARGDKDLTEISLLTGYNPAWISNLKKDPSFAELVESYKAERQQVFSDVLERMKALGVETLDELQARLAEEPEKWSKKELMDLAELMLVKPLAAAKGSGYGGASGGPGVAINVSFIKAPGARERETRETLVLEGVME